MIYPDNPTGSPPDSNFMISNLCNQMRHSTGIKANSNHITLKHIQKLKKKKKDKEVKLYDTTTEQYESFQTLVATASSTPSSDTVEGSIGRTASYPTSIGLPPGCSSLPLTAVSKARMADETLGGQRGLANNFGVGGTKGFDIPSGI